MNFSSLIINMQALLQLQQIKPLEAKKLLIKRRNYACDQQYSPYQFQVIHTTLQLKNKNFLRQLQNNAINQYTYTETKKNVDYYLNSQNEVLALVIKQDNYSYFQPEYYILNLNNLTGYRNILSFTAPNDIFYSPLRSYYLISRDIEYKSFSFLQILKDINNNVYRHQNSKKDFSLNYLYCLITQLVQFLAILHQNNLTLNGNFDILVIQNQWLKLDILNSFHIEIPQTLEIGISNDLETLKHILQLYLLSSLKRRKCVHQIQMLNTVFDIINIVINNTQCQQESQYIYCMQVGEISKQLMNMPIFNQQLYLPFLPRKLIGDYQIQATLLEIDEMPEIKKIQVVEQREDEEIAKASPIFKFTQRSKSSAYIQSASQQLHNLQNVNHTTKQSLILSDEYQKNDKIDKNRFVGRSKSHVPDQTQVKSSNIQSKQPINKQTRENEKQIMQQQVGYILDQDSQQIYKKRFRIENRSRMPKQYYTDEIVFRNEKEVAEESLLITDSHNQIITQQVDKQCTLDLNNTQKRSRSRQTQEQLIQYSKDAVSTIHQHENYEHCGDWKREMKDTRDKTTLQKQIYQLPQIHCQEFGFLEKSHRYQIKKQQNKQYTSTANISSQVNISKYDSTGSSIILNDSQISDQQQKNQELQQLKQLLNLHNTQLSNNELLNQQKSDEIDNHFKRNITNQLNNKQLLKQYSLSKSINTKQSTDQILKSNSNIISFPQKQIQKQAQFQASRNAFNLQQQIKK